MSERSLIQEQRDIFHRLQQLIETDRNARAAAQNQRQEKERDATVQKQQQGSKINIEGKNKAYVKTKAWISNRNSDGCDGCVIAIIIIPIIVIIPIIALIALIIALSSVVSPGVVSFGVLLLIIASIAWLELEEREVPERDGSSTSVGIPGPYDKCT